MSDCRFGVSPVNYPDPDPDVRNGCVRYHLCSISMIVIIKLMIIIITIESTGINVA